MDTVTLNYTVSGQRISGDCSTRYASNTVNYILAVFDLDDNWQSFDSVRAVWHTDFQCISTVLDMDGKCTVPQEVLAKTQKVRVNLVGSVVEDDVLTDRLTTYPIEALIVDANARICGSETAEITPSQFEQYVAAVISAVANIRDIDSVELNQDYTLTFEFSDGTSTTVGPIRGEQGETGNGIESVELTSTVGAVKTYTITFTDGTTTTFDVTDGEVTLDELAQLLPTETASGQIASFPDGQAVIPAESLVADIDPIQDLNGYDAPWVGGAGKNKADITKIVPSANVQVSNDTIIVTGNANTSGIRLKALANLVEGETYTLTANTTGTERLIYLYGSNISWTFGTQKTLTATDLDSYVFLYGGTGTTSTISQFMIRLSSETDATYAPYENICPISGRTEVDVVRTGKNIAPSVNYNTNRFTMNDSGVVTQNNPSSASWGWAYSESIIRQTLKAGTYTASFDAETLSTNVSAEMRVYDSANTQLVTTGTRQNAKQGSCTFTITEETEIGICAKVYDGAWKFQLELGSTATEYKPYNGQSYTIQLGQTVYVGTLDVVSGVLTVTHKMVDMGELNWAYTLLNGSGSFYVSMADAKLPSTNSTVANMISSGYAIDTANNIYTDTTSGRLSLNTSGYVQVRNSNYTDATTFKTAMNGVQLCYELATPQTYQLTPQQIQTLYGDNNVWADSGDVSITYKADIQKYIDNAIATMV